MVTSAISRLGRSPEEGIKAPVKTSTTTNITLSGTGQTLNGVVTGTSDRVLVKDQTAPNENGTYNVGPDAWERTTDMNAADDLDNGMLIVDSNTNVLYSITFTGVWSPGTTALTFLVLLGAMPASIDLTSNAPIDLVDANVALTTGALDPLTLQHLEYDFQSVQSKSNATTAATLFLNPVGGDVNIGLGNFILAALALVDGRDVSVDGSAQDTHIADATIHFTEASIDHLNILNIGVNSHAAIDTHIADATLHFTEASIDHLNILNIGVNSHAVIDTHIADATLHFTEGSIDHLNILNIGVNSHAAIDTHIADGTIHFTQAAITITASQVSDFATAVAATASVTANTAKVTNATHTGQVTGATALALDVTAVTAQPAAGVVVAADSLIINDGGVLSEVTVAQLATFFHASHFTLVTETTTARTAAAFEAVMVDDDTAAGTVTITLPPSVLDDQIIVKKLGTTADVILDGDTAELIDGAATFTLTSQYASITIIADGTGWNII